jgi:serine protease Do
MPPNPLTLALAMALLAASLAAADPAPVPPKRTTPMAALGEQVRQLVARARGSIVRIEVDTPVPPGVPPGVPVITRRRYGTGFIVAAGGYVLTTAETMQRRAHWLVPGTDGRLRHVVGVAKRAALIDAAGRRFEAEVVGSCPLSNLALLRARALGGEPLELGDSAKLGVGSVVVAVGAAGLPGARLGLGLVNETHVRTGAYKVEDLLSVSVPVGGGAGGAPLFAADGRVAGMIAAVEPVQLQSPVERGVQQWTDGRYAGTVLAIPARFLSRAIPDLKTTGMVQYGYLGVRIGPREGAVVVGEVVADSPAGRAKLKAGDRLVALDGTAIGGVHDFERQIARRRPGRQVSLTLKRGGQIVTAKVVLGRRPKADLQPPAAFEPRLPMPRLPTAGRHGIDRLLREHMLDLRRTLRRQISEMQRQLDAMDKNLATQPDDEP